MFWVQITCLIAGSLLVGDATSAELGWGVFFLVVFLKG